MSHGNARLTPHGRLLIVQRHQAGWKQAHIAAAMGISRKCVKTWISRYADEGEPGLVDRSSRPHSMPTKTCPEVEARVVELRLAQRRGQDWLGPELGLAPRTVVRILRRHQVPFLRHCDPMTGEVIKASKSTVVRYERERPGELVHMDVKKLGRIPDLGGWRGRGETVRNHQARFDKTPIGYDFVHSAIDDCSRLAYSEIHPDEQAATCAGFFERALDYFAEHGITHVERLMTDNAFAYRHGSALRELCAERGIKHIFIRPTAPGRTARSNA